MMAARTPTSRFTWTTQLDNYASPRAQAHGVGEVFEADETHPETITLASSEFPFRRDLLFLLDDGATVRAFYVAGYGNGLVHVQPFPATLTAWTLGPHTAYHLKTHVYE